MMTEPKRLVLYPFSCCEWATGEPRRVSGRAQNALPVASRPAAHVFVTNEVMH
jgi:hypothetical protein